MSKPNPQFAGETVMLTRRTTQRQFLLRPDDMIYTIFAYFLAYFARQHKQVVSAVCVLSNHYHAVVTDNFHGRCSRRWKLMRDLHSEVARGRNFDLKRCENLWNSSKPGNTTLYDRNAVLEKLLYVWLQAVEAGLVERVEDWPGFQILPRHWGKELTFHRPELGLLRSLMWPPTVTIVPMPPPCFRDEPLDEVIALFEGFIREGEARIARTRRAEGKSAVLGAERAKRVDPFSSPTTPRPRGKLNPRIATKNSGLLALAKKLLKRFRERHQSVRVRFRDDDKTAVFPAGTIAVDSYYGANCARVPRDHPAIWQRQLAPY